jgi:predicted DNA-binding transcriptional regulator YafY
MGRSRPHDSNATVTRQRAGRLYRLLTQIAETWRARQSLVNRLKVDPRGFYRDLELLRSLGIEIETDGDRYRLVGTLDEACARLPFPDPGLSLRDALQLANGRGDAHRKLQSRINSFLGTNGTSRAAGR